MSEEQIIEFLTNNIDYFVTNDLVISIIRTIGWMLVKGVNYLIEGSKTIYNATFGMIDITRYTGIENFITEYEPLLQALLVISLVVLGYMYILGKEKKNDLLTSLLIFAVVFTSSAYLFTTMNSFTILFKDAVISGDGDMDGNEFIRQNLYDLRYIDQQIGLANMDSSGTIPQYAELTDTDLRMINISETISDDEEGLTAEAEDILSKQLVYMKSGSILIDVYNGVAMTSFMNTFYFRYQFHYGTYFLNAFAMILLYFGLGYVNVKVIVELLRSRVLVTLFSADLSSKKKAVRILESIRDGYYALCFTAVELRLYMICTEYVNGITEVSSFVRGIILVFISFTMIEGSSIAEKITGVDAGITATTHRLMGAAHAVRGAVQLGMQAKQMSTLSSMNKARAGAGNNETGRGMAESGYTGSGTDGMPGNDDNTSRSGEGQSQTNKSGTENVDAQRNVSKDENVGSYRNTEAMENSSVSEEMNQTETGGISEDVNRTETGNISEEMNQTGTAGTSETDTPGNYDNRTEAENGDASAADRSFAKMDSELDGTAGKEGGHMEQNSGYRESPEMSRDSEGMFERWGEKQDMAQAGNSFNRDSGKSGYTLEGKGSIPESSRQDSTGNLTSEKTGETAYDGGERNMFSRRKTDVRRNLTVKKEKRRKEDK